MVFWRVFGAEIVNSITQGTREAEQYFQSCSRVRSGKLVCSEEIFVMLGMSVLMDIVQKFTQKSYFAN
jgi:hypothetical protein